MAEGDRPSIEIFDGGPPLRLEKSLGLIKPDERRSFRRAVLAAALVWLPLLILSAIESLAYGENRVASLIGDLSVGFRYLIVVPVLILAEEFTIVRMGHIGRHFVEAGLIKAADRPRFDTIIAQSRGLLISAHVEVLVVILAYLGMIIVIQIFPEQDIPPWHKAFGVRTGYSWAGWWHALVSAPVALILLLGWLWRIFVWGRFLFRVSRLDLDLVSPLPVLEGGLEFVGVS